MNARIPIYVSRSNFKRFKSQTHTIQKILKLEGCLIDSNGYVNYEGDNIWIGDIKILPKLKKR